MKKLIVLITLMAAVTFAADITFDPSNWSAQIISENAGYANQNLIWGRTLIDPTPTNIFLGPDGPGTLTLFSMPSEWVLMLTSPDGIFSSKTSLSDDLQQHFQIASSVVSVEDLIYLGIPKCGEPDFNDITFSLNKLPEQHIPEPITFALVGIGLVGIGLRRI